jgi:predicted RNase H-like HicB family nuclease
MPDHRALVVIEEEGIWSAHDPKVPGAYGIGDSKDEAEADLREMLAVLAKYEAGERRKKLIGERKPPK